MPHPGREMRILARLEEIQKTIMAHRLVITDRGAKQLAAQLLVIIEEAKHLVEDGCVNQRALSAIAAERSTSDNTDIAWGFVIDTIIKTE